MRSIASASGKNCEPKISTCRIEWTFLKRVTIENHPFAGSVARLCEDARGSQENRHRTATGKTFSIGYDDFNVANLSLSGHEKIHLYGGNKKDLGRAIVNVHPGTCNTGRECAIRQAPRLHGSVSECSSAGHSDAVWRHSFCGRGLIAKRCTVQNCRQSPGGWTRRRSGRINFRVVC